VLWCVCVCVYLRSRAIRWTFCRVRAAVSEMNQVCSQENEGGCRQTHGQGGRVGGALLCPSSLEGLFAFFVVPDCVIQDDSKPPSPQATHTQHCFQRGNDSRGSGIETYRTCILVIGTSALHHFLHPISGSCNNGLSEPYMHACQKHAKTRDPLFQWPGCMSAASSRNRWKT
jgi:hypothetical protein